MTDTDRSPRLYVSVDPAKCCGYTTCADVCPEVFKLDEDGFAHVDDDRVPAGLEDKARAGAAACPEHAIHVGDTPPSG
ncbi:MAG TPA: ferredoxin [Acidimicrobiales bacterium]|nr:ferredoxin [Acidimicrobiales bacterium]